MSVERLKHMKETLMCAVEAQMYNLSEVDAEELGEVVDMIKDLDEALYYCAVVKAMEETEKNGEHKEKEMMYYTPMQYHNGGGGQMQYSGRGSGNHASGQERNSTDGRDNARSYYDDRMYYNGSSSGAGGHSGGSSSGGGGGQASGGGGSYYSERGYSGGGSGGRSSSGGGSSQYSEQEYPHAFQDEREGKSYRSRRMYMEAKETKQDKTTQMKELEKYAQELTQDIIEMVQDASPEERQYLSKKITVLANKVTQLNDTH